jgi:hypothetical protein
MKLCDIKRILMNSGSEGTYYSYSLDEVQSIVKTFSEVDFVEKINKWDIRAMNITELENSCFFKILT